MKVIIRHGIVCLVPETMLRESISIFWYFEMNPDAAGNPNFWYWVMRNKNEENLELFGTILMLLQSVLLLTCFFLSHSLLMSK